MKTWATSRLSFMAHALKNRKIMSRQTAFRHVRQPPFSPQTLWRVALVSLSLWIQFSSWTALMRQELSSNELCDSRQAYVHYVHWSNQRWVAGAILFTLERWEGSFEMMNTWSSSIASDPFWLTWKTPFQSADSFCRVWSGLSRFFAAGLKWIIAPWSSVPRNTLYSCINVTDLLRG